jgi:resuscitation-promoting factor RpfC
MGQHARHTRLPLLASGATVSLISAGALLIPGAAQAATTQPATLTAHTEHVQLWETHWHHVIHQARVDRGYYSGWAAGPAQTVTSSGGDGDGDEDDNGSGGGGLSGPSSHAAAPATTVAASSGYQACVIARESGGNPQAVNPLSGAGGLFQFLPSTWAGLGYSGLPQNAPVSVQYQAFAKLYAQAGTQPWSPSDGC